MTRTNGGPAFPAFTIDPMRQPTMPVNGPGPEQCPGMSLRDWFAGQILSGRMASVAWTSSIEYIENEVRVAYCMADAMLAERDRLTTTTKE